MRFIDLEKVEPDEAWRQKARTLTDQLDAASTKSERNKIIKQKQCSMERAETLAIDALPKQVLVFGGARLFQSLGCRALPSQERGKRCGRQVAG